jgi:tetratricopeptide (TPR) repeat protein
MNRKSVIALTAALLCACLAMLTMGNAMAQNAADYVEKAQQYYDEGDYEETLAASLEALEIDPNSMDAYWYQARALYLLDRDLEAFEVCVKAISINPNDARIYNVQANALKYLQRSDEAIASYEKAIELDPTYTAPYNNLGRLYYDWNMFDESIAYYDKAIELDPTYLAPYYNLGLLYYDWNMLDESMAYFDKAIELDPSDVDTINWRGNVLKDQGKYDEALEAYDKAIEIDPDYKYPYANRAKILLEKGFYDEAVAEADKAIALDPEFAFAYVQRGWANWLPSHLDEALQDFDKAIKLDPKSANAYNGRSAVLRDLGRHNDSLKAINKAIELDPNNAVYYYNRAITYKSLKQYDKALKEFDAALRINPNYLDAIFEKADTTATKGDFKGALNQFDTFIADNPLNASAYAQRGQINYKQHNYQQAADDFATADFLTQGQNGTAKQMLDQLQHQGFNGKPAAAAGATEDYTSGLVGKYAYKEDGWTDLTVTASLTYDTDKDVFTVGFKDGFIAYKSPDGEMHNNYGYWPEYSLIFADNPDGLNAKQYFFVSDLDGYLNSGLYTPRYPFDFREFNLDEVIREFYYPYGDFYLGDDGSYAPKSLIGDNDVADTHYSGTIGIEDAATTYVKLHVEWHGGMDLTIDQIQFKTPDLYGEQPNINPLLVRTYESGFLPFTFNPVLAAPTLSVYKSKANGDILMSNNNALERAELHEEYERVSMSPFMYQYYRNGEEYTNHFDYGFVMRPAEAGSYTVRAMYNNNRGLNIYGEESNAVEIQQTDLRVPVQYSKSKERYTVKAPKDTITTQVYVRYDDESYGKSADIDSPKGDSVTVKQVKAAFADLKRRSRVGVEYDYYLEFAFTIDEKDIPRYTIFSEKIPLTKEGDYAN